jgi:hypothetical protein
MNADRHGLLRSCLSLSVAALVNKPGLPAPHSGGVPLYGTRKRRADTHCVLQRYVDRLKHGFGQDVSISELQGWSDAQEIKEWEECDCPKEQERSSASCGGFGRFGRCLQVLYSHEGTLTRLEFGARGDLAGCV